MFAWFNLPMSTATVEDGQSDAVFYGPSHACLDVFDLGRSNYGGRLMEALTQLLGRSSHFYGWDPRYV